MHIKLTIDTVTPDGKHLVSKLEGSLELDDSDWRKIATVAFTSACANRDKHTTKMAAQTGYEIFNEWRDRLKQFVPFKKKEEVKE